jgi:hypothetical protein
MLDYSTEAAMPIDDLKHAEGRYTLESSPPDVPSIVPHGAPYLHF